MLSGGWPEVLLQPIARRDDVRNTSDPSTDFMEKDGHVHTASEWEYIVVEKRLLSAGQGEGRGNGSPETKCLGREY